MKVDTRQRGDRPCGAPWGPAEQDVYENIATKGSEFIDEHHARRAACGCRAGSEALT